MYVARRRMGWSRLTAEQYRDLAGSKRARCESVVEDSGKGEEEERGSRGVRDERAVREREHTAPVDGRRACPNQAPFPCRHRRAFVTNREGARCPPGSGRAGRPPHSSLLSSLSFCSTPSTTTRRQRPRRFWLSLSLSLLVLILLYDDVSFFSASRARLSSASCLSDHLSFSPSPRQSVNPISLNLLLAHTPPTTNSLCSARRHIPFFGAYKASASTRVRSGADRVFRVGG